MLRLTIGRARKLALVWKKPLRLPANRLPLSTAQDLGVYSAGHIIVAIEGAAETAKQCGKVNTTLL